MHCSGHFFKDQAMGFRWLIGPTKDSLSIQLLATSKKALALRAAKTHIWRDATWFGHGIASHLFSSLKSQRAWLYALPPVELIV